MVVVTGASAGIGRACVRAFAALGDSVALLARGGTGLAEAAAEVRGAGGRALDRYLAGTGFSSQETGQPRPVDEPDNLERPADAADVLTRVGHALGAGPLGHDAGHARRAADLMVYLRQHHAERDLEQLGRLVAREGSSW